MKVLFAADIFSGCTWYRCVVPGHALHMAPEHDAKLNLGHISKPDIEWCDVLVVQRLWEPEALMAVQHANMLGKLTVFDLDDDLWTIAESNTAHKFWKHEGNQRAAEEIMRACKRVTTTNAYLADALRKYGVEPYVIPNALPDDFVKQPRAHSGVVLGWAGSNSHRDDIESVTEILRDVLDARPHVRLKMAYPLDCSWFDHPHLRRIEPVHPDRYHGLLSHFDIGIAPLVDTHFNRCKSDLKFVEYAALGIPSVCSAIRPYAETVEHGETGYLASTPDEWRQHLLHLIDDEADRQRIGANAQAYAEGRRIGTVLPLWLNALSA